MEKGKGKSARFRPGSCFPFSLLPFSFLLFLCSCGTPGEPRAPRSPVPVAVTDLGARQVGDAVRLTLTLPEKTLDGEPLDQLPDIEIYRVILPAGDTSPADPLKTSLVMTIPSALVETYRDAGQFRFDDSVQPAEAPRADGERRVYAVKTRASKRRGSEFSNPAAVRVFPVPQPIASLRTRVTEHAVELEWEEPARTSTGVLLAAIGGSISGFRVFRVEVPADGFAPSPSRLLGPAAATAFRDAEFEFGRTYRYTVRSVVQYQAGSAESADAAPAEVTPRDLFAPAAPQGLVVMLVPGDAGRPAQLELSWNISPEADAAGYHLYRSEQDDSETSGRGERISSALLPVPAFRDTTVRPGRRYLYSVTAVDRAANESARSAAVSGAVPAPAP